MDRTVRDMSYKDDKSEPEIKKRLPNGYSMIRRIVSRSGKKVREEYNICKGERVSQPIYGEWFRVIDKFNDKYDKVVKRDPRCDYLYNLLSRETGELLSNEWFIDIDKFNDKCASVINERWWNNLLSFETGELVFDDWFPFKFEFNDKYALVLANKQCNLLSYDTGELLSDEWFEDIKEFNDKYAKVENKQKQWNLLSYETGELLSAEWFRDIRKFSDEYAEIRNEQEQNNLLSYETGEIVFDGWSDGYDVSGIQNKLFALDFKIGLDDLDDLDDLDEAARKKGIYSKNESSTRRHEGRMTGAKTAVCECCGRRFSVK